MSVSTFAPDFDDKAEPIDQSKHSVISKGKSESHYNHSKYSVFFKICSITGGRFVFTPHHYNDA
jgi:hypothetical protein